MIKTIDDLRKCYAVRADKEVFELFMDKCEEFGITWAFGNEQPRDIKCGEVVIFSGLVEGVLTHDRLNSVGKKDYKRLTLSDFKPNRTEYVQVTESIFDLRDEFERGELYCKNLSGRDDYQKLNTEVALFGCAAAGNVYRRVEKVVDERQEFIDELRNIQMKIGDCHLCEFYDAIYESGKFKLICANGEIE